MTMDKDQLARVLLATFVEELDRHVASLNGELLALEKAQDPPSRATSITALLRTLHAVKGSSRAVNATLIEQACHEMEGLLEQLRAAPGAPPAELTDLMFGAADALEDAGARLKAQQPLEGSALALRVQELQALRRGAGAKRPGPAPGPAAGPTVKAGSQSVRVGLEKLDALLARTGDARISSLRLDGRMAELEGLLAKAAELRREMGRRSGAESAEAFQRLEGSLSAFHRALEMDRQGLLGAVAAMEEDVRRARLLPFEEACAGLERAARDVARAQNKEVALEIRNGAQEIDRKLVETLRDPLLQLVRNAVAHGITPADQRRRAGKAGQGRVVVESRVGANRVVVTVDDDGEGLDLPRIRDEAARAGLPLPEDDEQAMKLVFTQGLSTAPAVTAEAGRGVGLDVVRAEIEAARGRVSVSSQPGRGTRFTIELPLTLGTVRMLMLSAGGLTLALPVERTARVVRLAAGSIQTVDGRAMWSSEDGLIPVGSLASLLGVSGGELEVGVLFEEGRTRAVIGVEEVLAEREVAVRALGRRLRGLTLFGGAALMPEGEVVLVLNPTEVSLRILRGEGVPGAAATTSAARPVARRILLVEDAPTTRMLEQNILEAAGYTVLPCSDGEEAWRVLEVEAVDAVVSDVEMPRLDGFGLTERIRRAPRLARLPVVLVTAREQDEDKRRGLEAGASAYVVKSAFEQTILLETLARLL